MSVNFTFLYLITHIMLREIMFTKLLKTTAIIILHKPASQKQNRTVLVPNTNAMKAHTRNGG